MGICITGVIRILPFARSDLGFEENLVEIFCISEEIAGVLFWESPG